mgnify:CR=1 FL=1
MRGYRVIADFGPGRVFPFYAHVSSREAAEKHAREAVLSGAVRAEVVSDGALLCAYEPDERGKGAVRVPSSPSTRNLP